MDTHTYTCICTLILHPHSLSHTHTHAHRLLPCTPSSGLPLGCEASPLHAQKEWSSATALGLLRNQGRLCSILAWKLGSEGLPARVEGVVGTSLGSESWRRSGWDCSCHRGVRAAEHWALAEGGVKSSKGRRLKQDPCLSSGPLKDLPRHCWPRAGCCAPQTPWGVPLSTPPNHPRWCCPKMPQ